MKKGEILNATERSGRIFGINRGIGGSELGINSNEPEEGNTPVIQLKKLTKMYGSQTAVDQLTLNIYRGEIFGLLGPNGAGKSTTILMILGLTEPTSGNVYVCGVNSTRQPIQVKKRVGYLPDDIGFYEDLTGLENLLYTARLNRIGEEEALKLAEDLLKRVGLMEAKDKKTGAYSRGMRQRLGLADVLMKQPDIIILDEPTLGIDPKGIRELLALIRELSRDAGITVLLSSHQLHQVQQICDRVGLFVKGKLIAEGDVESLSEKLFNDHPLRIELAVGSPVTDELMNKLKAVEGVKSIEQTPFDQVPLSEKSLLRVDSMQDISGELARIVVESGALITRLNKQQYGLDEIYQRYFEGEDGQ